MGLTLVLGIVLAINSDAFQVWDLWVIAAIVLWALFAELGRRTGPTTWRPRSSPRA